MTTVGILPNLDKDKDLTLTKKILEHLLCHKGNVVPVVSHQLGEILNLPEMSRDQDFLYKQTDFLVVLGGDGTVLHAAKDAAVPLLGINLGHLGYLTDVDKNEALSSIDRVLRGKFKRERRMMLDTTLTRNGCVTETRRCLNDVCVLRGTSHRMICFELYINDEFIDSYRADGIIVSTPTGSTAYNLSAGGPILKPDAEMIAITLICPHALYIRPSVVSADDAVMLKILEEDCALVLDGENELKMTRGDLVTIKRSSKYTTIYKTNGLGFYDILRIKMLEARK